MDVGQRCKCGGLILNGECENDHSAASGVMPAPVVSCKDGNHTVECQKAAASETYPWQGCINLHGVPYDLGKLAEWFGRLKLKNGYMVLSKEDRRVIEFLVAARQVTLGANGPKNPPKVPGDNPRA